MLFIHWNVYFCEKKSWNYWFTSSIGKITWKQFYDFWSYFLGKFRKNCVICILKFPIGKISSTQWFINLDSFVFTVWKSTIKRDHNFTEKSTFFRQINVFTKEVTKELNSRNFFCVIAFWNTFPHCSQCGKSQVFVSSFFCKNCWKIPWKQRSKGVT